MVEILYGVSHSSELSDYCADFPGIKKFPAASLSLSSRWSGRELYRGAVNRGPRQSCIKFHAKNLQCYLPVKKALVLF